MDARKKELINAYKRRPLTGGVCVIRNLENGRYLLKAETNLQGSKSQFEFSQMTGSCVSQKLQQDWSAYGGKSFRFEILEEITQKDSQTPEQFREDVATLGALWAERFDPALSY